MKKRPEPAKPARARQPMPAYWTWVLFAAGALYQLGVLRELSRSPYFGNPILDARYQIEWALALAGGHDPHPLFFQSPLYSYLVAGFVALLGWHVWGIVLVQWAGMLLVAVIVWRTLLLLEVRPGLALACFAFALFYPLYPYYAAMLHKTALEIVLHALVLYLGVRMLTRPAEGWAGIAFAVAFGFVCSLAAFVRATFQVFALLPWLMLKGKRVARIGAIALGFLIPFTWATWHNARGAGEWVPLQTSFGFNLFLGNNPWNPEGAQMPVPGLSRRPLEEEVSSREYAEQQSGKPLTVSQVNAFYVNRALDFMRSHTAQYLETQRHKLYWYLHREELPDNDCYRCMADEAATLKYNPLHWGWLALGALPATVLILASWFWRRRVPRAQLWSLAYGLGLVAVTMVFFVNSRVRIGHAAAWLVIIALGIEVALREWRAHRGAIIAVVGLGLIPGFVLLTKPLPVYTPDDVALKLAWLYNDLDEFDQAAAVARTLQDAARREALLARIEELRLDPGYPARKRHLLGNVIPRYRR